MSYYSGFRVYLDMGCNVTVGLADDPVPRHLGEVLHAGAEGLGGVGDGA